MTFLDNSIQGWNLKVVGLKWEWKVNLGTEMKSRLSPQCYPFTQRPNVVLYGTVDTHQALILQRSPPVNRRSLVRSRNDYCLPWRKLSILPSWFCLLYWCFLAPFSIIAHVQASDSSEWIVVKKSLFGEIWSGLNKKILVWVDPFSRPEPSHQCTVPLPANSAPCQSQECIITMLRIRCKLYANA